MSVEQIAGCSTLVVLSSSQYRSLCDEVDVSRSVNEYCISYWRHLVCGHLAVDIRIEAPAPDSYYVGLLNSASESAVAHGAIAFDNPQMHAPFVVRILLLESMAFLVLSMLAISGMLTMCICFKTMATLFTWYNAALGGSGEAPPWSVSTQEFLSYCHETFRVTMIMLVSVGWPILQPLWSMSDLRFFVFVFAFTVLVILWLTVSCDAVHRLVGVALIHTADAAAIVPICYCTAVLCMNWLQLDIKQSLEGVLLTQSNIQDVARLHAKGRIYTTLSATFMAILVESVLRFILPGVDQKCAVVDGMFQWTTYAVMVWTLMFRWEEIETGTSRLVQFVTTPGQEAMNLPPDVYHHM
eukprot:CAMPEP_0194551796 /NCGR_PEP_ID=MMETSP0253-20130528/96402_1 /TAXON_ID=2966 /ORGANISM="Noctiluca scintillans" /LENGTH=353 /DNA_ID=CAMNT_0039399257 /DNA_START=95 /DNA_END=1156 /DNA_ORIENTATION=+